MEAKPNIIIATNGTVGDMLPFLDIARELSSRGHRVQMLAPIIHEELFRSQGIEHTLFGTVAHFHSVLDDPDLWNERKGMSVIWRAAAPYLEILKQLIDRQPSTDRCILLCHPFMVPAANIAKTIRPDLRIVSVFLGPSGLCSAHDLPTAGSSHVPSWTPLSWRKLMWRGVSKWVIDPYFLPQLNAARTANKLRPVTDYLRHMIHDVDATVAFFPPWFGAKQPDWPANSVEGDFPTTTSINPAELAPALHRFLASGVAPIAFTPGTGNRQATKYFATALQALQRLHRRGLFVTPYAEQVPANLPPDVMWIDRAPFDALLPHVAALVHHGGIGTTVQAFRSGTPQLIAPYGFDQFDNAYRAHKLGVAEIILQRQWSVRRLHRQLERLLSSPTVAQSCADLAKRATEEQRFSRLIEKIEMALGVA